jgi:uncharacterized protein
MYEKGEGVVQDYTEATKWYRKAADQGLAEAEFKLGLLSESGLGVMQDYVVAYMWFYLAAEPFFCSYEVIEREANLDRIIAKMNPTEIAEAKRLAQGWAGLTVK